MSDDEAFIIKPEHQNALVEAAHAVYEMLRDTFVKCRFKLEALEDVEKALEKLRVVKEGDEILTTDHNDFIHYLRAVRSVLKKVAKYIDLAEWDFISLDYALEAIREVQTGDIITPEDFDSILRALREVYNLLGRANLCVLGIDWNVQWATGVEGFELIAVADSVVDGQIIVGWGVCGGSSNLGALAKVRVSDGVITHLVTSAELYGLSHLRLVPEKDLVVVCGGGFVGAWTVNTLTRVWRRSGLPIFWFTADIEVSRYNHLVCAPASGPVVVYNARTGAIIKPSLQYPGGTPWAAWARYSPDGKYLLISTYGYDLVLFETTNYNAVWYKSVYTTLRTAFTRDGTQIIGIDIYSYEPGIEWRSVYDGELVQKVYVWEEFPTLMYMSAFSLTPDDNYMLIGGLREDEEKEIPPLQIRRTKDGEFVEAVTYLGQEQIGDVSSFAILDLGNKLALSDRWNNKVYLVD